jgi:hypothetical protein
MRENLFHLFYHGGNHDDPLIYSLTNKDIKLDLRKTVSRRMFWLYMCFCSCTDRAQIFMHLIKSFLTVFIFYFCFPGHRLLLVFLNVI